MKKITIILTLTLIISFVLSFNNTQEVSAAPKFGSVKTVNVKLSRAKLAEKINWNKTINNFVNNRAVDGGFTGLLGGLAKSSIKKAGIYGAAAGGALMGIDRLTKNQSKHFGKLLKQVKNKKAKGIIISKKYKYHKSFDIGDGGGTGFWIQNGPPTFKTY